jgi:hypothetical protein
MFLKVFSNMAFEVGEERYFEGQIVARDYLPSVGEPGRGLVTQAAKGTAAEGGGIFCVPPVPGKQAFRAGLNAKKAPGWVPFLLVARRGFEPLLPG